MPSGLTAIQTHTFREKRIEVDLLLSLIENKTTIRYAPFVSNVCSSDLSVHARSMIEDGSSDEQLMRG